MVFFNNQKLIPFSIANLLNGGNVEIYGNGLNIRHWLHVDDTCEGIYTILKKAVMERYIILGPINILQILI